MTTTLVTNDQELNEQATAAEAAPDAQPGPAAQFTERYFCPECRVEIGMGGVHGNLNRHSLTHKLTRTVRVWCDHCEDGFKAVFDVTDGRLVQRGLITKLAGEERDSFRNRVEKVRGDLRTEKR